MSELSGALPLAVALNPAQRAAVEHTGGPLLVVAGAGSGKTRVLAYRIAHLIGERGVPPYRILAITFTNKAAAEMRERVMDLVGPRAERMWVSTFHSACVRILRSHAERVGYKPSFTIYDEDDARRVLERVILDAGLDPKRHPARKVKARISRMKSQLIGPEHAVPAKGPLAEHFPGLFTEYQKRLAAANAMDFDDLIVLAVTLLRNEPDVLAGYQERFAHVLVDEYQDTDVGQNELVRLLSAASGNVFAVGDADQSIYGFRGANVGNMLDFVKAFPDATVVMLEQNYRSTQGILDAANGVIACNRHRADKSLWSELGAGEKVRVVTAEHEFEEASWVVNETVRLKGAEGLDWRDIAVFYRTNGQSRVLEEAFTRAGVPYTVVGATGFFERREVRDCIAYLRLVRNPDDEVSLRRVVNVPRRGVGERALAKFSAWAGEHGVPLTAAIGHAGEAGITGKAAKGIESFLSLLADARRMDAEGLAPREVLRYVLDASGYPASLGDEHDVEAEGRRENVGELASMAASYADLQDFLEHTSLVNETDDLGDASTVSLMTLHAAKGLEFPAVFMTGMEEGLFPHARAWESAAELEEERRLCYVGITRAKRNLALSRTCSRTLWGYRRDSLASRFVDELPEHCVERLDLTLGLGGRVGRNELAAGTFGGRHRGRSGREDVFGGGEDGFGGGDDGFGGGDDGFGGGEDVFGGGEDGFGGGEGLGREETFGGGDEMFRPAGTLRGGSDAFSAGGGTSGGTRRTTTGAARTTTGAARTTTGAARTTTGAARTTTGAEALHLVPGDPVVHARWGDGVIVALSGEGERAEAEIRFPAGVGVKRFLLCMTPLRRA